MERQIADSDADIVPTQRKRRFSDLFAAAGSTFYSVISSAYAEAFLGVCP
jgi:hypothetical protein